MGGMHVSGAAQASSDGRTIALAGFVVDRVGARTVLYAALLCFVAGPLFQQLVIEVTGSWRHAMLGCALWTLSMLVLRVGMRHAIDDGTPADARRTQLRASVFHGAALALGLGVASASLIGWRAAPGARAAA